jgi:hypothetical protein
MLTIVCITLTVAVIGLFFMAVHKSIYGDNWLNATLGELKVKKLTVVSDDGQPKIVMGTQGGAPIFAVLSGENGPRMYVVAVDGQMNLMFEHGPKTKALMNSDGIEFQNGDTPQLALHAGEGSPIILIRDADSEKNMTFSQGIIQLGDESKKMIRIASIVPSIQVQDEEGYASSIGRTSVRHGKDASTTISNAATIVGSSKTTATAWPLIKEETAR